MAETTWIWGSKETEKNNFLLQKLIPMESMANHNSLILGIF